MTDEGVHVNTLKIARWTLKHEGLEGGRHFLQRNRAIFYQGAWH